MNQSGLILVAKLFKLLLQTSSQPLLACQPAPLVRTEAYNWSLRSEINKRNWFRGSVINGCITLWNGLNEAVVVEEGRRMNSARIEQVPRSLMHTRASDSWFISVRIIKKTTLLARRLPSIAILQQNRSEPNIHRRNGFTIFANFPFTAREWSKKGINHGPNIFLLILLLLLFDPQSSSSFSQPSHDIYSFSQMRSHFPF